MIIGHNNFKYLVFSVNYFTIYIYIYIKYDPAYRYHEHTQTDEALYRRLKKKKKLFCTLQLKRLQVYTDI